MKRFKEFTAVAAKARNRFRLFRILDLNYLAWKAFIMSLLRSDGLGTDDMLELDRLMLNFLTSARALIDHFKQYYVQTHRNTPEEAMFNELLSKLARQSWAFAFYQDYRNYVQHCELPVCNYSKNVTHRSVELKVEADAERLLKNYSKWEMSKLAKSHGKLDLIKLTQEYYQQLAHTVGPFLAKAFFPKIVDANDFFANLTLEVDAAAPEHAAVLCNLVAPGRNKLNVQYSPIPSNLFSELGIQITQN